MTPLEELMRNKAEIEKKINTQFEKNSKWFLSFVHRSYVNENKEEILEHNERLEFLGDAVLGLIISSFLFDRFEDYSEGQLSYLKSTLVGAKACSRYFRFLKLDKYVLLGKGEKLSEGRGKDSIDADAFEAVIGAVYLEKGYEKTYCFLLDVLGNEIEKIIQNPERNFKAELQEKMQKRHLPPPTYEILEESGPEHSKTFLVAVYQNGKQIGQGMGSSKRKAEQNAAKDALEDSDEG
ncbi:MAG TPA: ribonuclease III [Chlamydiales bacterium]|nr:ribonuclease III [Chlamydiales bacterium]